MERYECYEKWNNKWLFLGWYELPKQTKFEELRKETKKFIYINYTFANGDKANYRYRK